MKRLLMIALGLILMVSCKKRVYHSFTDDERAYMVYNAGDVFKLKDENTGEIIEFKVVEKHLLYREDTGPGKGFSRKEHLMEQGEIKFSDASGNNSGYIYIYKDKIDQFTLSISMIFKPNYNFGLGGENKPSSIENITVNGVTYKNVHNFFSDTYLSLEYGFIQLINTNAGGHYTRVP